VLSGIEFLESKDLVHGNITCSSVLLNDDGEVKISMQERCTVMSKEIKRAHPDVQAVEDMMQLLKKREGSEANDLRRWSSTAEEFLSKITSASAVELLQVSEFGPLQMTITLTFEACFPP